MEAIGTIERISAIEEVVLSGKPIHYKREVLLHVGGDYPKKLLIKFWGEKACKHLNVHNVGDNVSVITNVESKNMHGVWHTNITGYYIKNV